MLLLEDELSQAIRDLLREQGPLRIAVAFIGTGASGMITKAAEARIICNLSMGGTNPREVRVLARRFGAGNMKQIDTLHAKLYIGGEHAIVGSANLSNNGLGVQPAGLREAGYRFTLEQPGSERVTDWFDTLWASARPISEDDLQAADERWQRRDRRRDGGSPEAAAEPVSLCEYDFDRDDFPLITWYEDTRWTVSGALTEGKTEAEIDRLKKEIDASVSIESPDDEPHMSEGRHIFSYRKTKREGLAGSKASDCTSVRSTGTPLRNAYHFLDDPDDVVDDPDEIDVMLCTEAPALFGLDQKRNYDAFRNLINQDRYRRLRHYDHDDEHGWFHTRLELTRQFWKELQAVLCTKQPEAIFREE